MIKFKDPRSLIYFAFQVCEVDPCDKEAEHIWANSETRIIDICNDHYTDLKERELK